MASLKQYTITKYYRGIELTVICVATTKKKFSELLDIPIGYINKYSYINEPRVIECIENPNILYAECGLGGEAMYIFKRGEVKLLSEYKELIDKHREVYPTRRDYDEAKGNG